MLNERFLSRLHEAYPEFYDKVSAQALEDAVRIRREAGGDLEKALVRARLESAGRVWWPYVKGVVPFVGNDRAAMEAFSRLVLTVDHVAGHAPPTMEAARKQTVEVLRASVDVERLRRLVSREKKDAAEGAAAGVGLVASMSAVLAPLNTFRSIRKWGRFMPVPVRVTLAAVIVAALLSVPLVAGYSAGRHATESALGKGASKRDREPSTKA